MIDIVRENQDKGGGLGQTDPCFVEGLSAGDMDKLRYPYRE
jgi:hypothetical protein